jgi:phage gp46-like protein
MDIALTPQPASYSFDWSLTAPATDIAVDNGLDTAILLSLFTDRLANPDDVIPDGTGDRRGCWMDVSYDGSQSDDRMGSRLWLLRRAKATQQTLLNAIAYTQEALDWLGVDGIAATVALTGGYQTGGSGVADLLALAIVITRLSGPGAQPVTTKYDLLWSNSLAQPPILAMAA